MKKILSLILAGLMTVSCASYIFADDAAVAEEAEAEVAVEEVAEEAEPATPYDFAIKFLGDKMIMQGKEDGKPHAADAVKRYEMALFMGRVLTGWVANKDWEDHEADSTGFTDLADSGAKDFLGALSFVSQKGIIEGYGDGTFKPEQTVTYREALTMAVRTLGYKGLAYPWGYIEKAVALGLTDGISGIAYTDEIARGVVAQIVFNMMVCADSAKLALGGYAWEPIIITATDKAVLGAADAKTTDAKLVGFKTVDELGQIGETAYYVDGAIFGFEGAHDDELALGHVYKALFEIDDAAKVDLYAAVPYETATIANVGLTDDEGNAYEDAYPINTFLGKYDIVSKYSVTALNNQVNKFGKDEIIILDALKQLTAVVVDEDAKFPFAVDWATGNILERVADTDNEWTIKWYWNETFDCFFDLCTLADAINGTKEHTIIDDDAIIGVKLVNDKDIEDLKKAIADARTKTIDVDGYVAYADTKSAYASLVTFNMDADEAAERGIFEAYRLGYYSASTVKAKNTDGDEKEFASAKFETKSITGNSDVNVILEGAEKYDGKTYWFVDEAPEAACWVVYGINNTTGAIKIVKVIDGTDADSYVATGVVRGYSLANKQIWIGEEKIDLGYANLLGSDFTQDFGVAENKEAFSDAFDKLFNNFVEYVVVDGKVVYIARKGNTNSKYLVVESFAGINNEGYIVVNGYSTESLKLERFAIDTFGGWKKGDFFFNPEAIEDEFIKGSVYEITSYDEENDLYYVNCLGCYGNDYNREFEVVAGVEATLTPMTLTVDADGYKTYKTFDKEGNELSSKETRVSDADKYIIIGSPFSDPRLDFTTPIYVFEGKALKNWKIEGDALVATDNLFIIVNPDMGSMKGFYKDTYNTGFVAFTTKPVVGERVYDGYDGAAKYLLGATETIKLAAFDLLTGNTFEGYATNKTYAKGEIYGTIGNIFGEKVPSWDDFKAFAQAQYAQNKVAAAKYAFDDEYIVTADTFDKEKILGTVNASGEALYTAIGYKNNHKDIVADIKVFTIEDGDVTTITKIESLDDTEIEGITSIEDAFVIYNLKENKVVIYADLDGAGTAGTDTITATTDDEVIEVSTDAYIEATAEIDVTLEDDEVVGGAVKSITLNFFGKATEGTHKYVRDNELFFGNAGDCFVEDWAAYYKVDGEKTPVYTSLADTLYTNHEGICSELICKMVQSVTFTFEEAIELDERIVLHFTNDAGIEYNIVVLAEIKDGEVELNFGSGHSTIDDEPVTLVADPRA